MIVNTTPIIPGQKDRAVLPVRSLHNFIDEVSHKSLPRTYEGWWMLTHISGGHDPRNCRQRAMLCRDQEVLQRLDVFKFAVVLDGVEERQRVPDARRLGALLHGEAILLLVILAIRFGSFEHVVAPTHARLVQQVG